MRFLYHLFVREGLNTVCFAPSKDGSWYRAVIINLGSGTDEVEVFFADFGFRVSDFPLTDIQTTH